MGSMDRLVYTTDAILDSVRDAAGYAASECGYDQFEEVLLDFEIVDIRRVSSQSVKDHYAAWLQPPCSFSSEEIVRVDWQTWAVPKRFNNDYEGAVIARAESIIVAIPTLLAEEVFTYGLGPEYNWLEWGQGFLSADGPSASAFEALGDLIVGEWKNDVCEAGEGDSDYLDEIHPRLREAVAKAIGIKDGRA